MKHIRISSSKPFLLFISLCMLTLIRSHAQDSYAGKYYIGNISNAWSHGDQPFRESYYCVLRFGYDSVEAFYFVQKITGTAATFSESTSYLEGQYKKYKWITKNSEPEIIGFKEFDLELFKETDTSRLKSQFPDHYKAMIADSLIWYSFANKGKPSLEVIQVKKEVAKEWGIEIVFVYVTSDSDQMKAIADNNEKLFKYLAFRYGKTWELQYHNRVRHVLKLKQSSPKQNNGN